MCWARDGRLLQAFGGASRLTRIRQVPKSVGVCSCGFVSAHKAGIGIVIVCVIQSYPNRRRVELWRANRVFGPCALPWGLRNKDPPNQLFWFRVCARGLVFVCGFQCTFNFSGIPFQGRVF